MGSDSVVPLEPIHESAIVLAGRILFLQLAVGVAALIANADLVNVISPDNPPALMEALGVVTIILQTLDAIMLVILALQWAHRRYLIAPREITIDNGVWHVSRATHKLASIESVEVRQSLPGKLFSYGTLVLYNPTLKSEIYLHNLPDPYRYSATLEKFIAGE